MASVAEGVHHAPDGAPRQVLVTQLAGIDIAVLDQFERFPEDTEILRHTVRDDAAWPAGPMGGNGARRGRRPGRGLRRAGPVPVTDGHARHEHCGDQTRQGHAPDGA